MSEIQESLKQVIIKRYDAGLTYKEISKEFKVSSISLANILKGRKSCSERMLNCRARGRYVLSIEGRKKLSDNGKKACKKNGKIWTKPEREFKSILNKIGIGVKFPETIKEIIDLEDDIGAIIFYQYPIQRYLCDFVYVSKKIVFRVQGDFWHGNPLLYSEKDLTKIQKFNISRDKNKRKYLEKQGWKVVDVWESEIYWNKEVVKNKIQAIGAAGSTSVLHTEGPQFDPEIAYYDWEERVKELWFKKPKGRPLKKIVKKKCLVCDVGFEAKRVGLKKEQKYCSPKCFNKSRRKVKNRPSKEQLSLEIKETNYCTVGRKYGVSDNCIRKWLKSK